ncbi:MAG: hypothetical protein C0503_09255 [Gemmatimonas sp.]|nr:hypothetical protein [Gemmatimonas sp.]
MLFTLTVSCVPRIGCASVKVRFARVPSANVSPASANVSVPTVMLGGMKMPAASLRARPSVTAVTVTATGNVKVIVAGVVYQPTHSWALPWPRSADQASMPKIPSVSCVPPSSKYSHEPPTVVPSAPVAV